MKRPFHSLVETNPFANFESQCSPYRIQTLVSPNQLQYEQPNAAKRFQADPHGVKRRLDTPMRIDSPDASAISSSSSASSSRGLSFDHKMSISDGRCFSLEDHEEPASAYKKQCRAPLSSAAFSSSSTSSSSLPASRRTVNDDTRRAFEAVPRIGIDSMVPKEKRKFTREEVDELLQEQQAQLQEEFSKKLYDLLGVQFESFTQFHRDYVSRQPKGSSSPSYFS